MPRYFLRFLSFFASICGVRFLGSEGTAIITSGQNLVLFAILILCSSFLFGRYAVLLKKKYGFCLVFVMYLSLLFAISFFCYFIRIYLNSHVGELLPYFFPLIFTVGGGQALPGPSNAGPSNVGQPDSLYGSFPSVPRDFSPIPSDASVPSIPSIPSYDGNEREQSVEQPAPEETLERTPEYKAAERKLNQFAENKTRLITYSATLLTARNEPLPDDPHDINRAIDVMLAEAEFLGIDETNQKLASLRRSFQNPHSEDWGEFLQELDRIQGKDRGRG